jgi:hypothetical protein
MTGCFVWHREYSSIKMVMVVRVMMSYVASRNSSPLLYYYLDFIHEAIYSFRLTTKKAQTDYSVFRRLRSAPGLGFSSEPPAYPPASFPRLTEIL